MIAQGIYAEGKQHAMAVGIMKMSSTEMYALLCTAYCQPFRASRLNEVPTI